MSANHTLALLLTPALVGWYGAMAAPPAYEAVPIENPSAFGALEDALLRLQVGLQGTVRVYHFGNSNIRGGDWPAQARGLLQQRYGDGGPGYLVPRPGGIVTRVPVRIRAGGGWKVHRSRPWRPGDGANGLGFESLVGRGPEAWIEVRSTAPVEVAVHFVCHPEGGTLRLQRSGNGRGEMDTRCSLPQLGVWRWKSGGPPSRHVFGVQGGPVRLLGIDAAGAGVGLAYDAFGVNGQHVSAWLYSRPGLLREQLAVAPADLVILSYGGNEAFDRRLTLEQYQTDLEQALTRVRELAPDASCLLVGPIATCPEQTRLRPIIYAQRAAAHRHGCGFWDSAQVAGGPGGLCSWRGRRPPLVARDGYHLSRHGYRLIGRAFGKALLEILDHQEGIP